MNLTDAIRCDVGLQGILLQLCCCCCGGDTPLLFCSGSCGTKLVSFAVSMIARARFPDSANTAVGNSCTAARVCGHRPAATFTTASCLGFIVTLQETPPRGVPRRARVDRAIEAEGGSGACLSVKPIPLFPSRAAGMLAELPRLSPRGATHGWSRQSRRWRRRHLARRRPALHRRARTSCACAAPRRLTQSPAAAPPAPVTANAACFGVWVLLCVRKPDPRKDSGDPEKVLGQLPPAPGQPQYAFRFRSHFPFHLHFRLRF